MRLTSLFTLCLMVFGSIAFAETPKDAQKMVHLLSYLAQDYQEAVQEGQVINQFEYDEQIEFMTLVRQLAEKTNAKQLNEIQQLERLIHAKSDPKKVSDMATRIKTSVIASSKLKIAPQHWPNLDRGRAIFLNSCVSCHGMSGRGDGKLAANMNPKPSNFHNPDRMSQVSPFQIYNTLSLGIEGTPMPAFDSLPETERWDLAFYVSSLRHRAFDTPKNETTPEIGLKKLASLSDEQLKKLPVLVSLESKEAVIASLRTTSQKAKPNKFIRIASENIEKSFQEYKSGHYELAEDLALEAYLNGIEPIEPMIKQRNNDLLLEVELVFGSLRKQIRDRGSVSQVEKVKKQAGMVISKIRVVLLEERKGDHSFWLAFGIVLREALESLLVVAAILAFVKTSAPASAQYWVHGGWMSSVVVGIIVWILFGRLISFSGFEAESIEGFTSLLAVLILIYVGFWFHRQSQINLWTSYIEGKVKKALSTKKLVTLASLSFLAVFREVFETVLFLKSITISSPQVSSSSLILGTVSAISVAVVVGMIFLKVSRKIPIGFIFKVSTLFVFALAFVLAGKGIHALQEAGILSMSSNSLFPRIESLGIFPTMEVFIGQLIVVTSIALVFLLNRRKTKLDQELM